MNTDRIEKLCNQYGLNKTEFVCILTYFQTENKNFSYAETIAKQKKLKHLNQDALNFFNRTDVQKFILQERNLFWSATKEEFDDDLHENKKEDKTTGLKDNFVPLFEDGVELTTDNLKKFLEIELSRMTDPKDRAATFIKAAESLSLNDSGNVDFEKPVIYLPDRIAETAI